MPDSLKNPQIKSNNRNVNRVLPISVNFKTISVIEFLCLTLRLLFVCVHGCAAAVCCLPRVINDKLWFMLTLLKPRVVQETTTRQQHESIWGEMKSASADACEDTGLGTKSAFPLLKTVFLISFTLADAPLF